MLWSYDDFPSLRFDRPADGVLRITLDAPGLNSVGPGRAPRARRRVARGRPRSDDTNVAVLQGAGKAFSSGGSFELIDSDPRRLRDPRRA